jgi:hypothetical protein
LVSVHISISPVEPISPFGNAITVGLGGSILSKGRFGGLHDSNVTWTSSAFAQGARPLQVLIKVREACLVAERVAAERTSA